MRLTLINLAKKGRTLLVQVKSTVSDHKMLMLRDKMKDKLEFIYFDPIVQQEVIYRELKKVTTIDKKKGSGAGDD